MVQVSPKFMNVLPMTSRVRGERRTRSTSTRSLTVFQTAYNVVNILEMDRDSFIGQDQITVYNMPSVIMTCIDRIRRRVKHRHMPGRSPTLTCCLVYGLDTIMSDPTVTGLLDMKKKLDLTSTDVDADDLSMFADWFRTFPLAVPSDMAGTMPRANFRITEEVNISLKSAAENTGLRCSLLVVLSMFVVLSEQDQIHPEWKLSMERTLKRFYHLVHRRQVVAKALLNTL